MQGKKLSRTALIARICLAGIITYCLAFGFLLVGTGFFIGPHAVVLGGLIHLTIGIVAVITLIVILSRSQ